MNKFLLINLLYTTISNILIAQTQVNLTIELPKKVNYKYLQFQLNETGYKSFNKNIHDIFFEQFSEIKGLSMDSVSDINYNAIELSFILNDSFGFLDISYNDVEFRTFKNNKVFNFYSGIKNDFNKNGMNEKIKFQLDADEDYFSKYECTKNIIQHKGIPGYMEYKKFNPYSDSSFFIETLNQEISFDSDINNFLKTSKIKCLSSALELLMINVDKKDNELLKKYLQRKDMKNFYFRYLKSREIFLKKRHKFFLQYQKTNNRKILEIVK